MLRLYAMYIKDNKIQIQTKYDTRQCYDQGKADGRAQKTQGHLLFEERSFDRERELVAVFLLYKKYLNRNEGNQRGNSMPQKRLEKNFQRFTQNFKLLKKPLLNQSECVDTSSSFIIEPHNHTFIEDNPFDTCTSFIKPLFSPTTQNAHQTMFWDQLGKTCEKLFQSLKGLSITQTQELEVKEVERKFKGDLEKLKVDQQFPSLATQIKRIKETFTKIIGKIQLIASRSFQNYKLKDVKGVFSSIIEGIMRMITVHIGPLLAAAITKLKMQGGMKKLKIVLTKVQRHNKRAAIVAFRIHGDFHRRKAKIVKFRNLLTVNSVKNSFRRRQVLTRAMVKWKLAGLSADTVISKLCQGIFSSSSSDNPWGKLHLLVHNLLLTHTKIRYGDFIRFDSSRALILASVPQEGYAFDKMMDEDAFVGLECSLNSGGIIPSILKCKSIPEEVEVNNMFEDSRLNRKIDLPFVNESHKISPLSLLCVPIIGKGNTVLGAVRMYRKADRMKFSENCLLWSKRVAQCLAVMLPGYERLINSVKGVEEVIKEGKVEEEELRDKLQFQVDLRNKLKEVLTSESVEEVVETVEGMCKNVIAADHVVLLSFVAENSTLIALRNNLEVEQDLLALETIKRGKAVETVKGNKTPNAKAVLYIPIETGIYKGVLYAEKTYSDASKWLDTFEQPTWDVLSLFLPTCLSRVYELLSTLSFQEDESEKLTLQSKSAAVHKLFNTFDKLYKTRTFHGWNSIGKEVSFQYGNLKPQHTFTSAIIHVISTNIRKRLKILMKFIKREKEAGKTLRMLCEILERQNRTNLRKAWEIYRETTFNDKHIWEMQGIFGKYRPALALEKLRTIFTKYTGKQKEIMHQLFTKLVNYSKNLSRVQEMQNNAVKNMAKTMYQKIVHINGRFMLKQIRSQIKRKSRQLVFIKHLSVQHRNRMLRISLQQYRGNVQKIHAVQNKLKRAVYVLGNSMAFHRNLEMGTVLNRWRKQVIKELKCEESGHEKRVGQINNGKEQEEEQAKTLAMIEQILDLSSDTAEELFSRVEFSELVRWLCQYCCTTLSANECLFTFAVPTINGLTYYVCSPFGTSPLSPSFENSTVGVSSNFPLPDDDPIISSLTLTRSPLAFADLEKDDPIYLSTKARKLRTVRAGLIFPAICSGTMLGTVELYRRKSSPFSEDECKACEQLVGQVIQKFVMAASTVLASGSRKAEIEAVQNQNKLVFESLISSANKANTLSSILNAMTMAGIKLLGTDKTLIILIQEQQKLAYFYSFADAHVYNFDFAGTFIESIVLTGEPICFPTEEDSERKAQSINEEDFEFIRYIPITSKGKVTGICEMCYHLIGENTGIKDADVKMPELEAVYADSLSNELDRFKAKLNYFVRTASNVVKKVNKRRITAKFCQWRTRCKNIKNREEATAAKQERMKVEKILAEVMAVNNGYNKEIAEQEKEIQDIDSKIKDYTEGIEELKAEQGHLEVEKNAKLKFLAAALLFNQMEQEFWYRATFFSAEMTFTTIEFPGKFLERNMSHYAQKHIKNNVLHTINSSYRNEVVKNNYSH
eukprot:TRINITY_DN400_c0_g1_i1.p1 TRINITY_DN400_c0_g1~~TRINITY_DN400_c0_g1_i1.p1  ORF type:complete len:1547 (-),score=137.31 TRINITY_DN400_c0_g1_i1:937-5577(-)